MRNHTARRARGLGASFAAVALGVTGLVALATSASAHTATLTAEATCVNSEGNFTITWTLKGDVPSKTMIARTNWTSMSQPLGWPGLDIVGGGAAYSAQAGNIFTGSYNGGSTQVADTVHNVTGLGASVTAEGKVIWNEGAWNEYVQSVSKSVPVPARCVDEQPEEVPVDPAVFTAPTCEAPGTLEGVDTEDYEWIRSGPDNAAVLTATAIGGAILTGQTVYGPYDLTQLTGEECLSEQPPVEEEPPVEEAPPVVIQRLAETGFPLLGVLGLAGSMALIGGGLLSARRLLHKSN